MQNIFKTINVIRYCNLADWLSVVKIRSSRNAQRINSGNIRMLCIAD
jgi:hypothetical protein